jgi:hypothetical protein
MKIAGSEESATFLKKSSKKLLSRYAGGRGLVTALR